ncbi:MAG: hypothetical protein QM800_06225 [Paludibacter sp.]
MLRKSLILLLLIHLLIPGSTAQKISLAGEWNLFTDLKNEYGLSLDKISFDDKILLPVSLDEAGKGIKSVPNSITSRFLRKYSFYGKAWYQREIIVSANWKSKHILFQYGTHPCESCVGGWNVGWKRFIALCKTAI